MSADGLVQSGAAGGQRGERMRRGCPETPVSTLRARAHTRSRTHRALQPSSRHEVHSVVRER